MRPHLFLALALAPAALGSGCYPWPDPGCTQFAGGEWVDSAECNEDLLYGDPQGDDDDDDDDDLASSGIRTWRATAVDQQSVYNDAHCRLEDDRLRCRGMDEDPPEGRFRAVAVGRYHGCALTLQGGEIDCWGDDSLGQADAPAGGWESLAAGKYHSCALDDAGRVACWGDASGGQLDVPAGRYDEVVAHEDHSCALTEDGAAVCWGDAHPDLLQTPAETGLRGLSTGSAHACARRADDSLICWGESGADVRTPPSGRYAQVAVGDDFACARDTRDEVTCWGQRAPAELEDTRLGSLDVGGTGFCALDLDERPLCYTPEPWQPPGEARLRWDDENQGCFEFELEAIEGDLSAFRVRFRPALEVTGWPSTLRFSTEDGYTVVEGDAVREGTSQRFALCAPDGWGETEWPDGLAEVQLEVE